MCPELNTLLRVPRLWVYEAHLPKGSETGQAFPCEWGTVEAQPVPGSSSPLLCRWAGGSGHKLENGLLSVIIAWPDLWPSEEISKGASLS